MGIVIGKLKAPKFVLNIWNKNVFGNVDGNIAIASDTLTNIQKWYNDDSFSKEFF